MFFIKLEERFFSDSKSVFIEIGLHVVLLWMLGWFKQIYLRRTKTTSTA